MPMRAWVEIDVARWRRNFELINSEKRPTVALTAVLKDEAYGHGAVVGARLAEEAGVRFIAVATIEEALALRKAGIRADVLLLGQRLPEELPEIVESKFVCCLHDLETAVALDAHARSRNKMARIHVEVDTGMSRYGARWTAAVELIERITQLPALKLEGVMSHFAISDEFDKTFANLQHTRFRETLHGLVARGINPGRRHICNSGGFLDLPAAHLDMVRLGILHLGVYPSQVCRRIPGIQPVMSVKTRIAHIQNLVAGDKVGYGMRYTAPGPRRIAVLPIGYGDGFPRVRSEGAVLIAGKRAPLVGGVSMDAITVDITEIPQAKLWDEAVVLGEQASEVITAHDVAALKNSVSYDVLTNWRNRLPRVYLNNDSANKKPRSVEERGS